MVCVCMGRGWDIATSRERRNRQCPLVCLYVCKEQQETERETERERKKSEKETKSERERYCVSYLAADLFRVQLLVVVRQGRRQLPLKGPELLQRHADALLTALPVLHTHVHANKYQHTSSIRAHTHWCLCPDSMTQQRL